MSRNRSCTLRGYTMLSSSLIAGALTVAGLGWGTPPSTAVNWASADSAIAEQPTSAGAGRGQVIGNESDNGTQGPPYRSRADD